MPGTNGICATILRKAWPTIKVDLTRTLEKCMRECTYPDIWKTADVVTLLKSRDKDPTKAKSYRPVSLLQTISKVLGTLIVRKLHTETETSLSTDQYGFREGKFTIGAILTYSIIYYN